jgi:antibiotic biosynthesis monooxygenase
VIARLWHGITLADKAQAYLAFLQARAVPDYRSTPGNLSVDILHREAGYLTHFLIVTHWESKEAIVAFAGHDIGLARYYPEDRDFLLEFEPRVEHYALHLG